MTLRVLSAGAAKGLVLALQPRFAAQFVAQSAESTRVALDAEFGAVGAMRDKLLAGDPCDMIILTAAMIDVLAMEGRVIAGSRVDLGRVLTGIAVPSTQPKPDVGDEGRLSAALSSAAGIYLPDPERATAGIHFANVLRTLGILDAVRDRLRPYPSGAVAMHAMADASSAGEDDLIGCTQVTEILYSDGVTLAGLLPKAFELATMYAAGVCAGTAREAAARAFVALLGGEDSVAMRRDGGFVVG